MSGESLSEKIRIMEDHLQEIRNEVENMNDGEDNGEEEEVVELSFNVKVKGYANTDWCESAIGRNLYYPDETHFDFWNRWLSDILNDYLREKTLLTREDEDKLGMNGLKLHIQDVEVGE